MARYSGSGGYRSVAGGGGTVSTKLRIGLCTIAAVAGCVFGPALGDCALTVILTRHAERAQSADDDPPLSVEGKRRAQLLASLLGTASVSAIYATESRRTQETAQPLADLMHLVVQRIDADQTSVLVDAIRKHQNGVVVAVGHSNTVPNIIAALGGPPVQIGEAEFDNLFVVSIAGGDVNVVRLRYGAGVTSTQAPVSTRRSRVMKISFVRSGGLAAMPGLSVEGVVDLDDRGAKVTSASSKYQRELPTAEVEQLRLAADPARMSQARAVLASPSRKLHDAYQYDITVATSDGKSQKLTFNAAGGDEFDQAAPGLGRMVRWIDNEAQRIKEHRFGNR
jgi:broad specificity phosphatase PhoE